MRMVFWQNCSFMGGYDLLRDVAFSTKLNSRDREFAKQVPHLLQGTTRSCQKLQL